QMAFGQPVETIYKLDAADVIVSLDADFLSAGFPGQTRYARDFAKRRDPDSGKMSRLYVVESTPSATGAKADHPQPSTASEIEPFARALALDLTSNSPNPRGLVADLAAYSGERTILPGEHHPHVVNAIDIAA